MPPKYLNRQRPQQIGLNLTSVSTKLAEERNGSTANLRTDVQSYLANLEKNLHARKDLDNVTSKGEAVDRSSKATNKVKDEPKVLESRSVLHWSDLSISSESSLTHDSLDFNRRTKIGKSEVQHEKRPVSNDNSISSIINVKTLSDISIVTEIENKNELTNFILQKTDETKNRPRQIANVHPIDIDLESSLPPKSPFYPFTFKMKSSTTSSIKTADSISDNESESIETIKSASDTDNSDEVSDKSKINEPQADYETDFESEESGYQESETSSTQSSSRHTPIRTQTAKKFETSKLRVAIKTTQTDENPDQHFFPLSFQRTGYMQPMVPWSGNFYYQPRDSLQTQSQLEVWSNMDDILRSALSAHLQCIKNFAEFQSSVYDQWNRILKKQRRKIAKTKLKSTAINSNNDSSKHDSKTFH